MASDNNFVRIADSRSDADSPYTEELSQDHVSNENHVLALIRSDGTGLCGGTADTITDVANSVVTDAAPSDGAITNILVGHVIEVVDGAAAGTFATVTVAGSGSTFTVDTNLVTAGMLAGDTYRILYGINSTDMAHTHDGVDSAILSQPMTWVDDGTDVGFGLVSISAIVPVNTKFAQVYIAFDHLNDDEQVLVEAREPSTGTFREILTHEGKAGDWASVMAWLPVNSSRQIETQQNTGDTATDTVEVRSYIL